MPSILIVDDEPDLRMVMEMLFEMEGFTVVTAGDGEAALEALAEHPIDVVLSDLMMPRLDGLSLSRKIRALPLKSRLPIILHTASGLRPEGEGTLYNVLLCKPCTFEQQLGVVRTLLQKS